METKTKNKIRNNSFFIIIIFFLATFFLYWNGYLCISRDYDIEVCFTPPSGCGTRIAKRIDESKDNIHIQAYGFTHEEILNALLRAHKRGVKIKILLDKSNLSASYSKIVILDQNKINYSIDNVPGIAHSKVIVIDNLEVITGSFNFTKSADTRNAENVIFIKDKQLANKYIQNWNRRYRANLNSKETSQ